MLTVTVMLVPKLSDGCGGLGRQVFPFGYLLFLPACILLKVRVGKTPFQKLRNTFKDVEHRFQHRVVTLFELCVFVLEPKQKQKGRSFLLNKDKSTLEFCQFEN